MKYFETIKGNFSFLIGLFAWGIYTASWAYPSLFIDEHIHSFKDFILIRDIWWALGFLSLAGLVLGALKWFKQIKSKIKVSRVNVVGCFLSGSFFILVAASLFFNN